MIDLVEASQFNQHPRIRKIFSRREVDHSEVFLRVGEIIRRVRKEGDSALRKLTQQFDGVRIRTIRISPSEIEKRAAQTPVDLRQAITKARRNIEDFHRRQIEKSWMSSRGFGAIVGQRINPIGALGLYVPGGTAAYPSTVLMNAIPALVAGVKRIAVVTPPKTFSSSPAIAAALMELGLNEAYRMGGAQAIAALAYGTESIPRVDKIVGPGNRFVATAKRLVFGAVDIDMIAGPSEVVIVADEKANARWVAADLLAQAEHDEYASAICITNSVELARQVQQELEIQMRSLERRSICRRSIDHFGAVIIVRHLAEVEKIVNDLAPEHLELHLSQAELFSRKIKTAGAIFLGPFSPEAVGDYFAGPNHVLPTSGTARFSSPLGVYDFLKRTSIIRYSRKRLQRDCRAILTLARAENLTAHAQSVQLRITPGKQEQRRRSIGGNPERRRRKPYEPICRKD